MPRFLVHIHTGPADPNKATLGCLVALTAARKGHEVTVFFAGDGVHLLAADHAGLEGAGTGRLGDHLTGLAEAGARFRVSGMSAKARGYDDGLLEAHPAEFAMPEVLVDLAHAADTVLSY
ncbi:DsrE family protein [Limimaricola litoreus]|uniref:DsrE family protein n=1 Tax=Limimaricola litoreus TaxID=2955316 RepID=A0A9X2JR29_9RHOB|nr:DsrE family protein [Limimaricola litoreus]MCP1169980.1 DsrE family protein [Limimaricola litoreus]